jgi:hypothetical protein
MVTSTPLKYLADMPQDSEVIQTKPCPLKGTAEIIREMYLRAGIMSQHQELYIWDPYTGEEDFAFGEKPRNKRSRSLKAKAANRTRRENYRKNRDRRKSAKNRIAG